MRGRAKGTGTRSCRQMGQPVLLRAGAGKIGYLSPISGHYQIPIFTLSRGQAPGFAARV
jgi:hypothetical protein